MYYFKYNIHAAYSFRIEKHRQTTPLLHGDTYIFSGTCSHTHRIACAQNSAGTLVFRLLCGARLQAKLVRVHNVIGVDQFVVEKDLHVHGDFAMRLWTPNGWQFCTIYLVDKSPGSLFDVHVLLGRSFKPAGKSVFFYVLVHFLSVAHRALFGLIALDKTQYPLVS